MRRAPAPLTLVQCRSLMNSACVLQQSWGQLHSPSQHTGFGVSVCWEQPGTLRHCQPSPVLQTGTTASYLGFFVCLFYISCWEKKKSPPLIPSKALSSLPHDVSWLLSAPPKFPKTQLHPSGAVWPWVLEKFKRCRSSNHWFPKSQYRV